MRIQQGSREEESTAQTLFAPFLLVKQNRPLTFYSNNRNRRKAPVLGLRQRARPSELNGSNTIGLRSLLLSSQGKSSECVRPLWWFRTRRDKAGLHSHQLTGTSASASLSEISSWISSVFPESLLATELKEGEFLPPFIIRLHVSI